ncbi:hypothetical protein FB45DRAFT_1060593 [Roridomyces roridus]|uniref:DUF6533 domain-containing protein n=1 Tax=Roridomyces roridus TaxID=1738132 RepID=A0AAD7BNL8_9AGAR|nr:hypothetical protein FB45DRAFT_1060593 [Roridomyces roridus]
MYHLQLLHTPSARETIEVDYAVFASDHRLLRSFFIAGLVILIYDHILTLGMEIKYIWRSKLRPSTCWFLAVRYIGLAAALAMLPYHFMVLDHQSCSKLQWMWEVLIVSQEVLIEVTLALRVLAMYGFNRWVFSGFATAIGTLTGISLASMTGIGPLRGGC